MTLLNQDLDGPSTQSTAGLLEKVEILRSALVATQGLLADAS